MAVGLPAEPAIEPVAGIRIGTADLGRRSEPRDDLAVFEIAPGAVCAATFTRNAFCAAPVTVARRHLAQAAPRYLLVNAGNANAGTGEDGVDRALACCSALAERGGCAVDEVVPFSTGVIGEPLHVESFAPAIDAALTAARADGWLAGARAIMTTDTLPKGASTRFAIGAGTCTVSGIVKGSGMIRPDMATMLAFIATDAALDPTLAQRLLAEAVARSFNRITVDGDTSTNDACVLVATGASASPVIDGRDGAALDAFVAALDEVSLALAHGIVRDGEGATKLVTVAVEEGASEAECLAVADAVAHSPLVKTALFASDPNWGRILAAVGRSGLTDLDVSRISIFLGGTCIVDGGARAASYTEEAGQREMAAEEITIRVVLGRGAHRDALWTCDLSHDYVSINADYRS